MTKIKIKLLNPSLLNSKNTLREIKLKYEEHNH